MNSPPRVFIGTADVASQIADLKSGFRQIGCEAVAGGYRTGSLNTEAFDIDGAEYDGPIRWIPTSVGRRACRRLFPVSQRRLLRAVFDRFDLFVFQWSTFLPDVSDLKLLHEAGKKIAVIFVGSDVYWKPAGDQEFESYGLDPVRFSDRVMRLHRSHRWLHRVLRYLRTVERYADMVINMPALAQVALRPFVNYRHMLPLEQIPYRPGQRRDCPRVVFAPTDDTYKGTEFVLKAFEELDSQRVRYEKDVFRNVSNREAIQRYAEADILVGEMFYPGGGKQQREALAAGTVVVTNNDPRYPSRLPGSPPFVHANKDTLAAELRRIIEDYPLRERLAVLGRKYVEDHHGPSGIARLILDGVTQKRQELIQPSFFRNRYVPSSPAEAAIFNRWTQVVRDAPWYANCVPEGSRDGLNF